MSSSPQILRPTPRRPFGQSSPNDNETPSPVNSPSEVANPSSDSISRAQSFLNLTGSTLGGIYRDEPPTPWGTGAETPIHLSSSGLSLSSLALNPRRHSIAPAFKAKEKHDPVADAFRLGSRTILLFAIGLGYGLLVRHLHDDRQLAPFQVEGIIKPRNNWRYLVFWGVAGVALGSLLPWVDGFFNAESVVDSQEQKDSKKRTGNSISEWTPVVRSFGAFVGIAFAIRKLPWASTLQASLTLALVNPVLWYLVDRSKPGFILSTTIGLTGTALLLASNPDMMPSPALHNSRNSSIHHTQILSDLSETSWPISRVVSRETVEGAVWIWSVLFCSCVCFGNIGRMLALRGWRKSLSSFTSGRAAAANGTTKG